MRIKKFLISFILSTATFLGTNMAIAHVLPSDNDGDAFIKTWISEWGSTVHTLKIERNPAGSENRFHVIGSYPGEKFESDACNVYTSTIMMCGLDAPPAFFLQFTRNDTLHRITVSHLSGSSYAYYDPNYPPAIK